MEISLPDLRPRLDVARRNESRVTGTSRSCFVGEVANHLLTYEQDNLQCNFQEVASLKSNGKYMYQRLKIKSLTFPTQCIHICT
jgi:hypothetical protein